MTDTEKRVLVGRLRELAVELERLQDVSEGPPVVADAGEIETILTAASEIERGIGK